MKIIFMGTPDFAVPTLKKLYDSGYEVQAVFTQPDKPKGRGYKLTPPPVKVLAQEHDTPVYQPQSLKKDGEEYVKIINDLAPDCIVVAAYGKMLPMIPAPLSPMVPSVQSFPSWFVLPACSTAPARTVPARTCSPPP